MNEKPWLILTLRRTGGTSLTRFLTDVSKYPTAEHEPFNVDRVFGEITQGFRKSGDIQIMQAAVAEAVEAKDKQNIKHCIEIIPIELTRALIDTCRKQNYGFIVLTRQNEARRLLSLFLAFSTGAWGPEMAARVYPEIMSEDRKATPIDLQKVRNRARHDFFALGRVLSLLRNRRIDYQWLLFEELYFGEVPIENQVRSIAETLGISIANDDPRLSALSRQGGQKSQSIARYVEGYEEAAKLLDTLCPT